MDWALAALVVLALTAAAFIGAAKWGRGPREKYGPPPGRRRALGLDELDSRGWPEYPLEYTGSSAASVSHMVLRSA